MPGERPNFLAYLMEQLYLILLILILLSCIRAGISIAKGGGGAVVKKAVLLKMTVPDVPGPTKPAQGTP
jgi:hypothetical protein